MGENTKVEWAKHSRNLWIGCWEKSPACEHCYARSGAARSGVKWGKDADLRFTNKEITYCLFERWNTLARSAGVRERVFINSYSDITDPRPGPRAACQTFYSRVCHYPHLIFLLLTKEPWHYKHQVPQDWLDRWPDNVWPGFTAENQEWFDKRAPFAVELPAPVIWVSAEPLLGPLNISKYVWKDACGCTEPDCPVEPQDCPHCRGTGAVTQLDWMVIGGESIGQRPFIINHAQMLRDDCRAAGIPVFMKQIGSNPLIEPGPLQIACSHPKGGDWIEWPEDLRVREFPTVMA